MSELNRPVQLGDRVSLEVIERAHCESIMSTGITLGEAAAILGIDQATLYRKRMAWGMPPMARSACSRGRGGGLPGRGRPLGSKNKVKAVPTVTIGSTGTVAPIVVPTPAPVKRIYPVRTGQMSWRLKPPTGMPVEIYNLDFWSVLRIGLRLLEPKDEMAALWVTYEALEIVECLPMWQPIMVTPKRNGSHKGWLAVQSTMPMMAHFTGWNVYLDENMEVPFSMRCNGKSINGMFE